MAKLVVLEDDFTLLDLYKDVLKRADHSVFGATGLEELSDYFKDNTADIIIADLRLGATTAEETIQAVAAIRERTGIRALLISAQMMIYEETCRDAGFEHLLTKPFPNRVLIKTVDDILNGM